MINKIKNNLNEYKYVYMTFLLSSIVISIIFILQKIAPFGKNSMLDVDFYHQYGPLLNELYDRVKSGSSLLYSFNTGGGIPFFRNFMNYLSSPFNIVLFLFKKENIVMAFSIVIALKAIFASTTMSYFLKKVFKKDSYLICIFGLLYAYSGYFCAYYWNIMWLDGMVFLPLIIYGINKLIDERNPIFYIFSLAIMLFANYFIGYMICIFIVFYFLGYFCYRKEFNIKEFIISALYFGISSLLAAGLVCFMLLPLYSSLSSISATKDSFPSIDVSFKITDFLFNHITGVSRTVFASDKLPLPNVYCGLISIVLIIALFLNKKINKRFKMILVAFLTFFILSFQINAIDFIWHAFHVPNDLPWRYSFIYVFCLITFSYYSFIRLKDLENTKLFISFMITILFVLLAFKLDFANITIEKTIICVILLLVYFLLFFLYRFSNINKSNLKVLFTFFIMFECVYGININWNINHDIKIFMSDKPSYTTLINNIRKDDNDLYRIEKTNYLTLNDGAWYNYNSMSTFSSMAYESVSKTQRKLGISGNNINSYYYRNSSFPLYNTIFNVKYIMGDYISNNDSYYSLVDNVDNYYLNRYNYSSSLAYLVNSDIENINLISEDPFYNYENFVSLTTGNNNIFKSLKVDNVTGGSINNDSFKINSNGSFSYELDKPNTSLNFTISDVLNENVYLYIGGNNISSYSVNETCYYITSDEYYIVDTGVLDTEYLDIKINFKDDSSGNLIFYAYKMDKDVFNLFYDDLKDGFLSVKEYSDTYIYGNINASSNKTVFTTIAYDKGWKVYVDDKLVNTYMVLDSYMAFDIDSGEHEIKFVYYPENMKLGIIISSMSLFIVAIYMIFNKKKQ